MSTHLSSGLLHAESEQNMIATVTSIIVNNIDKLMSELNVSKTEVSRLQKCTLAELFLLSTQYAKLTQRINFLLLCINSASVNKCSIAELAEHFKTELEHKMYKTSSSVISHIKYMSACRTDARKTICLTAIATELKNKTYVNFTS